MGTIEAAITKAIIDLIAGGAVLGTIDELAKAVSNRVGFTVNTKLVQSALDHKRHRITYENARFCFTTESGSKR